VEYTNFFNNTKREGKKTATKPTLPPIDWGKGLVVK
jgi:hypothetical protein